MILQDKTVLYLADLPSNTILQDIELFLKDYKDDIMYINFIQNQRNVELHKSLPIKVIFKDSKIANDCRIKMNLRKIKGKAVRIMWDERDTSIRYATKNNLFVKGIPNEVTPREVYEYFMKFGDISSAKIAQDDDDNYLGYGYITYYKAEDAEEAIKESNGKKVFKNSVPLEVSHFQKKNERNLNFIDMENKKIYISNLPEKYTKEELAEQCKKYGEVKDCNIFIDGLGRNFGIISFSKESEAKEAQQKLHDKEINGTKLVVKMYQNFYERKRLKENYTMKMAEEHHNCNLHIRNIPLNATEEDLKNVFSKYGTIKSVRIEKYILDNPNTKVENRIVSKGFGYVLFEDPESCKHAMEALNNKALPGFESWSRPLLIEFFTPKYVRQFMNNQTHAYSFMPSGAGNNPQMPTMQPFIQSGGMMRYSLVSQQPPTIPFRQFPNNNNYFPNPRNNKAQNYPRPQKKQSYPQKNQNYKKTYPKKEVKKFDMEAYNKLTSEEEKREFIGSQLYESIQDSSIAKKEKLQEETIGKIAGMIMEISTQEQIELLEKSELLNNRINEAITLINQSNP